MDLSKFEGIRQYHDGGIVSEYNNVIPLGDSCIDRLGEIQITKSEPQSQSRGDFIDSRGYLWICKGARIFRYYLDDLVNWNGPGVIGDDFWVQKFIIPSTNSKVEFVESSVNPSVVFITDLSRIFYWQTDDTRIGALGDNPVNLGDYIFGMPDDTPHTEGTSTTIRISNIGWYDNKLFLVDTNVEHNRLWLTRTDPFWYKRGNLPDGDPGRWSDTGADRLWANWYSSTETADLIQGAVSFNGSIYIMNKHSIEVWSRTGVEDAPLQINPNGTIYSGGRAPRVIQDTLYLLSKDQTGTEFVGQVDRAGQFKRISNSEIEKRFNNQMMYIAPLLQREDSFIMVYQHPRYITPDSLAYCMGKSGLWWKWDNTGSNEYIVRSISDIVGVTNRGNLAKFDKTNRTHCDGTPIRRFVRDFFMQFPIRTIFRNVQIIADTGRWMDEDLAKSHPDKYQNNMWIKVSHNRGIGWSREYIRAMGVMGHNDKQMIWRNLGSGNSFVLEFGTSSNAGFQIYKVVLELQ